MRSAHPALLLATFGLFGCADRSSDPGAGEVGGTVVITVPGGFPPSLPPIIQEATSRAVADQVFERLADIGEDLNTLGDRGFTPRLAQRWSWAPDSLSIAFALDPRARWHDGRPVRASDVRFTLGLLKDPLTSSPFTTLLVNIDSISVADSLTAVVWFRRRTPEQFYDAAYQIEVLPEHVLGRVPRNQLRAANVASVFVGSGPFRMSQYEPGVRLTLIADTANYRGRPKLDRVIWSFSTDAGAAITQFMSGQSDIYDGVPTDVLPRLDSNPNLRVRPVTGFVYAYMAINQRDPRRNAAPHPIFADRQVRRALSMALDREAMLRNVFGPTGVLGAGPYPSALADSAVRMLPFDRAAAAAMLDSAGWRAGADGIRSKDGRPLAFSILVPTSSAQRMRYAVLLQEQFRAVGARVTVDARDIQGFIDRQNTRNFDMTLTAWSSDPAIGGIKQTWTTSGMVGGNNNMSYSNPQVDALIDSALTGFDPVRTRQYAHRAYQMIVDDAPAVWLYDFVQNLGYHSRLRPVDVRATGWAFGLARWWIPEAERIDRDRLGLRPPPPQP